MRHKTNLLAFLMVITVCIVYGQDNNDLFSRLQGISNNGVDFYNVDGIEISSHKIDTDFNPKNISKKFRQVSIKEKELTTSDSLLGFKNYYVFKSTEEPEGLFNNISYYFVESPDHKVIGFTFAAINKTDKELERNFINLVRNNEIPEYIFSSLEMDSINFAGRKIFLGNSCRWMGCNNVQCPYYGQMNWSVHKDLEDASQTVNNHFISVKSRKGGKVISDTTVAIIFEGTETTARKIVYDFTGITSALVGMRVGKTLTVYLVSAPVRQHYVSCVMSFWNNDQINPR